LGCNESDERLDRQRTAGWRTTYYSNRNELSQRACYALPGFLWLYSLEEREAPAFDEEAVKKNMESRKKTEKPTAESLDCGCPGSNARVLNPQPVTRIGEKEPAASTSELRQWPCQIKLVPANASYFDQAHLLIAADCTAYAYPNIHQDFMRGKITLIGCPKLDEVEYADKLGEILKQHEIKSITVLRMEVPCCKGLVNSLTKAMKDREH
jgi:hypothetical protein